MRKIATILISALCIATAVAQDEGVDDELTAGLVEKQVRRYTVEIIVFSYEEDVSVGSEIFLPDEPPVEEDSLIDADGNPPGPDAAVSAADVSGEEIEEEEPPAWVIGQPEENEDFVERNNDPERTALELILLTEEELTLSDEIRQFELLDAYETMMHFGWTQPTYPEEETPPIELRLLGEPPAGLDGTFTLYLSRYLHLIVDLALDAPDQFEAEVIDDDSFFSFGDARRQYGKAFDVVPPPVRFRIVENRILKNGELRYFDHPKFGVLAKITRIEKEEEDEEPEALVGRTGQ